MASNEIFKTEDEIFMKAIETVQALITEDNLFLTFFLKLEKSITKEASGQKHCCNHENKTVQTKAQKRENSKYLLQEKTKIQ